MEGGSRGAGESEAVIGGGWNVGERGSYWWSVEERGGDRLSGRERGDGKYRGRAIGDWRRVCAKECYEEGKEKRPLH